ncbi:AraC family transcriptional regulator [Acinetobacter sp. A47]|uniref:AraC family transcriptional regulator n=1 Tax=Acinetobacter sp. A47 TaxID=1561217 RepID=UPI0005701ADE|nr:AraC family transcriptional regulator [Acinetobacter sp. A47]
MKRSILGLMYLIQGMRHVGIDVDARLANMGIQADALDPASIIPDEIEWDILQHISQDISPEQGLYIGQHYALAGYGPFLMLLVTSETIHKALLNGVKFQQLTHLFGTLHLNIEQDRIYLHYQPVDLNTALGQLRAQCEISGTYKFLQDIFMMMGLDVPDIHIELPFSCPEDLVLLAAYQDYYGQDVRFGCREAAFILENSQILNTKIPSADVLTYRIYEEKCLQDLKHLKKSAGLKLTVVEYVQDYLEMQNGIIPSMAETACALHIPERTLRHQLQQMQTSYKEIREKLIKQKALKFIENSSYSIEQVAEMLGYSEPAAFNHAFKRWFGLSPRQYYRNH